MHRLNAAGHITEKFKQRRAVPISTQEMHQINGLPIQQGRVLPSKSHKRGTVQNGMLFRMHHTLSTEAATPGTEGQDSVPNTKVQDSRKHTSKQNMPAVGPSNI